MIHHLAVATKNFSEAHHFYTEVMGFELKAAVKRQAPGGGWTKHVFYDMGKGKLFAIWDLQGLEGLDGSWRSALSTGLGLPSWVNHIAFEADGPQDYELRKGRWLDHGYHVSEVTHEFIQSAYTLDPDGTMVEWTYRTRELDEDDRLQALRIVADDSPATERDYEGTFTRATRPKTHSARSKVPA